MIPWARTSELLGHASDLKRRGEYAAALPLCEERARLLEEHGAPAKDVASAWNYLAGIHHLCGNLLEAERAARWSIMYYVEHSGKDDEALATYFWMLSTVLESRSLFAEALPYMEEAIERFSIFHGQDRFVTARKGDLERLRALARG